MTPEEYRLRLKKLPIIKPTTRDMVRVCPHLTKEQVAEIFKDNTYIACPPLLVRDAYHVISYQKECSWEIMGSREINGRQQIVPVGTEVRPVSLGYIRAERISDSSTDSKSCYPVKYVEEATKFAEANWGDKLILDNWVSIISFEVQETTSLISRHVDTAQPRTKFSLSVALDRKMEEIVEDCSKPRSEIFDDAIVRMTLDAASYLEIQSGHKRYEGTNCAYCGAGLSFNRCTNCDFRFKKDHYRCSWNTPLSRKMVAFLLANGHKFRFDPEMAWDEERAVFQIRNQAK